MRKKKLIQSAVEHLRTTATTKAVYGEPVTAEGRTVIPVARVATQPGETPGDIAGEMKVKPVGVVEISGNKTRFVATDQKKKLTVAAIAGTALGLGAGLLIGRKLERK